MAHPLIEHLLTDVVAGCRRHYGSRLAAVAVFGSIGRGTARPDSDLDILVVADALPDGRVARAADFEAVETALTPTVAEARHAGLSVWLSPVLKTPAEIERGSPLMLDMVDDARILYDRERFLERALGELRTRLARLGARRIWRGSAWIWDLKPDYQPGEVFEL
jgi:predicted nucleotidyltransferase